MVAKDFVCVYVYGLGNRPLCASISIKKDIREIKSSYNSRHRGIAMKGREAERKNNRFRRDPDYKPMNE